MASKQISIKNRLRRVILRTCLAVLILTSGAFVVYELAASKQELERHVETIGQSIAANSGSSLLLRNDESAKQILSALSTAHHIVGAAFYSANGKLFVAFPSGAPPDRFPPRPPHDGVQLVASAML